MILDEKFSEKCPCPAVPWRGPEAGDPHKYYEFLGSSILLIDVRGAIPLPGTNKNGELFSLNFPQGSSAKISIDTTSPKVEGKYPGI